MPRFLLATTVTTVILLLGVVLYGIPANAQLSPTTRKAVHVQIVSGPELESASSHLAIIRWTSNNPGGSPEHFGVVHYGTQPAQLSETAQSPIRVNPTHPDTVFRVRIDGLKPDTTYYYKVDSMEANGNRDEVKSPIRHFTTP
jgi:phosphodiesterase/alkaline phosphatase D-like protein